MLGEIRKTVYNSEIIKSKMIYNCKNKDVYFCKSNILDYEFRTVVS